MIDGRRQMLSEQFQRIINRNAKMLCDLSNLFIAKSSANLLGCNWHVGAIAEPRLYLIAQASLRQLIHETLQIAHIGLGQYGRDYGWGICGYHSFNRSAQLI